MTTKNSHRSHCNNKTSKTHLVDQSKSSKKNPASEEDWFILKPMSSQCYYRNQVKVDFTPEQPVPGTKFPVVPVFNFDMQHWSRAFILSSEREYFLTAPLKEKLKFSDKYLKHTYYEDLPEEDHFEGFIMKPKDKYCQLCNIDFEQDYLEHIDRKSHRQKQTKSIATGYIFDLVALQNNNKKPKKQTVCRLEHSEKPSSSKPQKSKPIKKMR